MAIIAVSSNDRVRKVFLIFADFQSVVLTGYKDKQIIQNKQKNQKKVVSLHLECC
jgi:hypothetical protein